MNIHVCMLGEVQGVLVGRERKGRELGGRRRRGRGRRGIRFRLTDWQHVLQARVSRVPVLEGKVAPPPPSSHPLQPQPPPPHDTRTSVNTNQLAACVFDDIFVCTNHSSMLHQEKCVSYIRDFYSPSPSPHFLTFSPFLFLLPPPSSLLSLSTRCCQDKTYHSDLHS